jgi:proline dehydrogenase
MLGLQVGFDFCLTNVRQLVERAKELGNFVRIDMEDSSCTTDTLNIYRALRHDFDNVGFVIQAYLRRSLRDIRDMMNQFDKINVRVCKGIYIEPREIAFKDRELINRNFRCIVEELLAIVRSSGLGLGPEISNFKCFWESMPSSGV